VIVSVRRVAGIGEVVCAFLGGEAIEQGADLAPGVFGGARIGFAQEGLELGEDLFDRVEIGRVARQEEQFGAGGSDQVADGLAFVRGIAPRKRESWCR
jgi:hypothetical protein